jgi:hypothetical protein
VKTVTHSLMSLCLVLAGDVFAHEIQTHVNITTKAVQNLMNNDPSRPELLQASQQLPDGARREDDFFTSIIGTPLGRFFFHFLPMLNSPEDSINTSCASTDWGLGDLNGQALSCFERAGIFSTTQMNNHRLQDALAGVDPVTKSPTSQGWAHLGYVIHLLEDVTSPAHTRNDPHPCILGVLVCDAFEKYNAGATPNLPISGSLLGAADPATLTTPQQFFQNLETFVQSNFFSTNTVFDTSHPLNVISQDNRYFYASCLGPNPASDPACICLNAGCSLKGRKLAAKGSKYKLTGDMRNAIIDRTIAVEQFAELGPITVQYVNAFIQFYAPVLKVQVQGNGTVTSNPGTIDCTSGTCPALFVQGTPVILTANPAPGLIVSWGGDCASGGTSLTVNVTLTKDQTCIANFTPGITISVSLAGGGTGNVQSDLPGINCGDGGTACTAGFSLGPGAEVALSATPGPNSFFESWAGCSSVDFGFCNVLVQKNTQDVQITATFLQSALAITSVTCNASPPNIQVVVTAQATGGVGFWVTDTDGTTSMSESCGAWSGPTGLFGISCTRGSGQPIQSTFQFTENHCCFSGPPFPNPINFPSQVTLSTSLPIPFPPTPQNHTTVINGPNCTIP